MIRTVEEHRNVLSALLLASCQCHNAVLNPSHRTLPGCNKQPIPSYNNLSKKTFQHPKMSNSKPLPASLDQSNLVIFWSNRLNTAQEMLEAKDENFDDMCYDILSEPRFGRAHTAGAHFLLGNLSWGYWHAREALKMYKEMNKEDPEDEGIVGLLQCAKELVDRHKENSGKEKGEDEDEGENHDAAVPSTSETEQGGSSQGDITKEGKN